MATLVSGGGNAPAPAAPAVMLPMAPFTPPVPQTPTMPVTPLEPAPLGAVVLGTVDHPGDFDEAAGAGQKEPKSTAPALPT